MIDPVTQAPRMHKIVKAVIDLAEGGDMTAIKEMFDRVEGKAVQTLADDEEKPLQQIVIQRTIVHSVEEAHRAPVSPSRTGTSARLNSTRAHA